MDRLRAVDALYLALDQDAGDLVVPFLRTNHGGIFVEIEGNPWAAMRYVRHDSNFDWTQPSWNIEHCAAAAKGLARFHAGAQSVFMRSKRVQETLPASLLDKFPTMIAKLYSRFALQKDETEISALVLPLKDWLCTTAETAAAAISAADAREDLVPTVLHGDFHPGNCLFRGEQLRAIIDFEYVHSGSPIFDLAYGAAMFGTNWNAGQSTGEDALIKPDFQKRFITEYRVQARSFLPLENKFLIDDDHYLNHYLALSYLLILLWCCEQENSPAGCRLVEIATGCLKQLQT
jgi:Ser/Thr protein kinase RdoA (MazF antagonist)